MSKNLTDLEVFLEKYNTLLTGLASSKIYLETAYKYQDLWRVGDDKPPLYYSIFMDLSSHCIEFTNDQF